MKKYLLTLVALVCFGFTMNAQVNLQDGLVGYWPFNGNANDESGNGNDGTVNGATLTTDRFGNENGAYNFDGASWITIPDNEVLRPQLLSIAAWVKQPSYYDFNPVFYKDMYEVYLLCSETFQIKQNSGCAYYDGTGWQGLDKYYPELNTWNFIVGIFDGTTLKFYNNGNLVAQSSDLESSSIDNCSVGDFFIGRFHLMSSSFFNGKIDDIRVYDRALNEQEIQILYQEGQTVDLNSGLVAYYPFNGNANDESGNENHGAEIFGGVSFVSGMFDQAAKFDGYDNPGHIKVNNSTSLQFSDEASFVGWVRLDGTVGIDGWLNYNDYGVHCIVAKEADWSQGYVQYMSLNESNEFITWSSPSGFSEGIHNSEQPQTNYSLGVWIHLAHIYSQNDNRLYINGILINTINVPNDFSSANSQNLYFGRFVDGLYPLNGAIDEFYIYNRALTEQEIQALYTEGLGATISTSSKTTTVGRIIDIPVLTSELISDDNVIAYQFDFNYDNTKLEYLSNTLTGTFANDGSLQVNPTTGKLAIAWARETPLVGEGAIIKLQFKVIDAGVTTPTITNALYNTEAVNATNGTITATYKYGDIDANDHVQAYDAALAIQYSVGLDPIPAIDPLPWENWRIVTANVDGVGGVTANDASEILKYTVGLITLFPVENTKKSSSATNADISVEIENGEIVLKSTGELFGLNVFVNENFSALGQPENFVENALFAKNISATNYAFAIATANSPANNANIVRIPYSTNQNQSVTFDMIINTTVKSVTVGLTTGVVTINEQSVLLYPNPANSVLYLSGVENVNVSIFDISGRNVFNQLNVNKQVDISTLPKGLYTVKIENGNESITRKLIKN